MHKNIGFYKEDELVYSLNGKCYRELSNNLKHLVNEMFGVLPPSKIIHAGKIDGFIKPDLYIECGNEIHYVSLKTGRATVIHQEHIKSFVLYLRDRGISKDTQRTILLYHFGDGTMDGTGDNREPFESVNYKLRERIDAANKELNENKQLVIDFVDLCMFLGNVGPDTPADYIYHGSVDYGVLCSRKQIHRHLKVRDWRYLHCLHIGPLMIRPHARYAGKAIIDENRRHKVDVQWVNLAADMEYISTRYDG